VTHRDTSARPAHQHETPLQRMGTTLRHYRQQRGLSHRTLAARIGTRSSYISEIELGKRNIAVLTLLRLTHALRIPSVWLLVQVDPYATLTPPPARAPLPSQEARAQAIPPTDTSVPPPGDPTVLLPVLGATICQYRKRQRLTHKALAARTGLSPTYIGEIELGHRNLSVLSLLRIAEALELSVATLLAPLEPHHRAALPRTE
jgi:transcriptional regulator with XRE-family HTH domain